MLTALATGLVDAVSKPLFAMLLIMLLMASGGALHPHPHRRRRARRETG